MSHDWILDVLADLRNYALRNGLPETAAQAEATLRVARAEIRGPATDPGEGGPGGPPSGGWRN